VELPVINMPAPPLEILFAFLKEYINPELGNKMYYIEVIDTVEEKK
jgi:hypothetical protein